MTNEEIQSRLFALKDETYRQFQAPLIPTLDPGRFIGVRTPELRRLAKELYTSREAEDFMRSLPHEYFDENNLHGFIISLCKDYAQTVEQLDAFLPYVDNWATCDQLRPVSFKRSRGKLKDDILRWLASDQTYTVRFGTQMVMTHFLDHDFSPEWLDRIAAIRSEEYYVNMMTAWFFATALAKQWDFALPYLENGRLDRWCHNKTIQKAVESYRVSDAQKACLRSLKR